MLRFSIFGSLLVTTLASLPASAGTLCQTRALPSASTNWNSSMSFQKFDTSLGALTGISIRLTGHVAGAVLLESTDNGRTLISSTYQVILTVQRPDFTPLVTVTPGTNFLDNLGAYDGTLDFRGVSGAQHTGISLVQTVTTPALLADLPLFTGAGTIALPVSAVANSTAVGAGNLITQFITAADASVELCYEYAPDCNQNGIPDAVDIATGTSLDANQNGTPDECEPPTTGTEGCSHGYWKNHPSAWAVTGYSPTMSFNTVFGVTAFTPDRTLMAALKAGGGGMDNLGRQATAALLSAAHPGVDFPLTPAQVITLTAQSVTNGTFATQASAFDVLVNLGCPLN